MNDKSTDSLYNRLGGDAFLGEATSLLYARILIDDDLAPFFAGMNVKRIEARQRAFLAYAFAGPEMTPKVDLKAVHAPLLGKGLNHTHFDLLKRYLCDTMIELGINEHLIPEAVDRVEATRVDVMGETIEQFEQRQNQDPVYQRQIDQTQFEQSEKEKTMFGRSITFIFGIACYGLGMASLLYSIPWLGDFWLTNTLDSEPTMALAPAISINLALLMMFAFQHSVMARPAFKAWWTKMIPATVERSTYVALSGIAFFVVMFYWQPLGGEIWQLSGLAQPVVYGGFAIGWIILFSASFAQNHFDLFGLRQVWLNLRGLPYTQLPFSDSTMYKVSRHPIYVGWLTVIWCTPHMTASHLFLALGLTIYTLIAIQYEERDLADAHPEYEQYKKDVAMLLPLFKRRVIRAQHRKGSLA